MIYPRFLVLIVVAWGLSGCAKSVNPLNATVQGTVTIEGELAPRGKVSFHLVEGGPAANGIVHEDGSFTLQVGRGNVSDQDASQIPAGEYIATVVVNEPSVVDPEHPSGPPLPGARLTAAKYSSSETSGLKYTIVPGRNVINIEVEAALPEELVEEQSLASEEEEDENDDKEDEDEEDEEGDEEDKDDDEEDEEDKDDEEVSP